jgi:aspartate/methionine/tyrosine aminotransferase
LLVPAELRRAVDCLTGNFTICPPVLPQYAAVAAFTPESVAEAEGHLQHYAANRETLIAGLRTLGITRVAPPDGAFYVYADVTALLGREWGGQRIDTTLQLADYILDVAEVAVVPGEAFGPSGYLRFAYALGDDELLEGIQRLQKLFA